MESINRRIMFQADLGIKQDPISKITKAKKDREHGKSGRASA
jgi:hypothetical protein